MSRQLSLSLSLFSFSFYLHGVDGYSVTLIKDNITFKAGDILENIATNSVLGCARRCSFFEECVGIEFELENSKCIILQSAKTTSVRTNKEQYMKSTCDEGWSIFSNSCYYITPSIHIWTKCKNICEAEGGHLAVDTSEEESKFINLLRMESKIWIGGMRLENDTWAWVNREKWEYENWNPKEPQDEYCSRYSKNNIGWSDFKCNGFLHCLCEKESL